MKVSLNYPNVYKLNFVFYKEELECFLWNNRNIFIKNKKKKLYWLVSKQPVKHKQYFCESQNAEIVLMATRTSLRQKMCSGVGRFFKSCFLEVSNSLHNIFMLKLKPHYIGKLLLILIKCIFWWKQLRSLLIKYLLYLCYLLASLIFFIQHNICYKILNSFIFHI